MIGQRRSNVDLNRKHFCPVPGGPAPLIFSVGCAASLRLLHARKNACRWQTTWVSAAAILAGKQPEEAAILSSLFAEITAWIKGPGQAAETRYRELGYCRCILPLFPTQYLSVTWSF